MFNEMSRCICITFECIYFQETFSLHVASTKCVPATMDAHISTYDAPCQVEFCRTFCFCASQMQPNERKLWHQYFTKKIHERWKSWVRPHIGNLIFQCCGRNINLTQGKPLWHQTVFAFLGIFGNVFQINES